MKCGLVAEKCGMTRLGVGSELVPVTVLQVKDNVITQVKSGDYNAVQVAYDKQHPNRLTKALAGHYEKAGVQPGRRLKEFRVSETDIANFEVAGVNTVELFEEGQKVDVRGVSRGRGFSGAIRRWNFSSQRATHGNSLSHRALGSTGMCQTPGRVMKGKKMPGQYGNKNCTVQALEVVKVDKERGLLFIKGAVPGAKGGVVTIVPSVKEN